MRFPAALLLLSIPLFGQTPPPEVDHALRARVAEFFDHHVDGNFMKAFSLVAEDTKEYYFAAQKNQYISYEIGAVTYNDDFTRAVVKVVGKRKFRPSPQFPETIIDQPMVTDWKIENGLWVWYVRKTLDCPTPMSCDSSGKPRPHAEVQTPDAPKLPDISAGAMKKEEEQIKKLSKVDKPMVAMSSGAATTEKVIFHNGQPGYVRVSLDPGPKIEGFSAKLEKANVGANEDATVTLHYEPGKVPPPLGVTLKLVVEPLGQTFRLRSSSPNSGAPVAVSFGGDNNTCFSQWADFPGPRT